MLISLAKESHKYIIILIGTIILTYLLNPVLSIIPLILLSFICYFFRMPKIPHLDIEGAIISPAQGKVIEIAEMYEDEFFKKTMKRISIFLSIFDVHITYAPMDGKIERIVYTPGKFHRADKDEASLENEHNFIKIVNPEIEIGVRQISGLIARRVKCWVKEGEEKKRTEPIGIIEFGSRVEIYLPLDIEIKVMKNDRVKGGKTIVAQARH